MKDRRIGRLGLELRIIGPTAILTALVLPVAGVLLVLAIHAAGRPPGSVEGLAGVVLEGLCPLGASIAAVSVVGRDSGVELALTTPVPYRRILLTRMAIVAVVGAIASFLAAVIFDAAGRWPQGESHAAVVLAWAAPMVWLTALGSLAAVATRGPAAATGLIGGLWLAEILGTDTFAGNRVLRAQYLYTTHIQLHGTPWWVNRAALLVVGTAVLVIAGTLLRRPQRLLTGGAA